MERRNVKYVGNLLLNTIRFGEEMVVLFDVKLWRRLLLPPPHSPMLLPTVRLVICLCRFRDTQQPCQGMDDFLLVSFRRWWIRSAYRHGEMKRSLRPESIGELNTWPMARHLLRNDRCHCRVRSMIDQPKDCLGMTVLFHPYAQKFATRWYRN